MSGENLVYLLIGIIVIIFFTNTFYNNTSENFTNNILYKLPNQLTAKKAKAMVLSCMDFRLIDDEVYYFNKIGYTNNYDKFILAGASLGYNQDKFPTWSDTFDKHIEFAIDLHQIDEIMVVDHMGCGAYKILYNKQSLSKQEEYELHKKNLIKFKNIINKKFPSLIVSTLLMDIDGSIIKL
jgi:carbonic anhydrase